MSGVKTRSGALWIAVDVKWCDQDDKHTGNSVTPGLVLRGNMIIKLKKGQYSKI